MSNETIRPSIQVEYRRLSDLKPNPANARLHSSEQIKQIANSIKEFGFTNPILVDNNDMVIAGHGRLAAALKLELELVPVIALRSLNQTQLRALMIADNRLAENSSWDMSLLIAEIESLTQDDIKISLLGFTPGELETLKAEVKQAVDLDGDEFKPKVDSELIRLDRKKLFVCPHCHKEFTHEEAKVTYSTV